MDAVARLSPGVFLLKKEEIRQGWDEFSLHEHQKEGVAFLVDALEAKGLCILADDMGLGKTLTSVAVSWYFSRTCNIKTVVICPPSMLEHWHAQATLLIECDQPEPLKCSSSAREAARSIRQYVIHSPSLSPMIIMTHDTFKTNFELFQSIRNNMLLIIDEAHLFARTAGTELNIAIEDCKFRFRLSLTGTPLVNKLVDLHTSIQILCLEGINNVLGEKGDFVSCEKRIDNQIDEVCKGDDTTSEMFEESCQGICNELKRIKSNLQSVILRRKFDKIMQNVVPNPTKLHVFLNETGCQLACARELLDSYEKDDKSIDLIITQKFRSIYNIGMTYEQRKSEASMWEATTSVDVKIQSVLRCSSKFMFVETFLKYVKVGNKKIVIVSEFTRSLEEIVLLCTSLEIPFLCLTGQVTVSSRQSIIDNFTNAACDGGYVMILSKKAGGVGLNLTCASYIIVLEPSQNPSDDDQAIARIIRIGQTIACFVFVLISGCLDNLLLQVRLSYTVSHNMYKKIHVTNVLSRLLY